jgi:peptidoglycan/xylan/chitin deacetylase (PgdA/CDA1 family)
MYFASLYAALHQVLQPAFPGCLWTGVKNSSAIALTFDDGPHPQYTPKLLNVLKKYNISASFFWLGRCVQQSPNTAKAVYEEGHWIGLHGYDHRSFPQMQASSLKQNLELTQEAIAQACGLDPSQVQKRMVDVRPPNGLFTPNTLNRLREWNYRPVMWSLIAEDWTQPGVSVVVQRVLQQVRKGSLIVLHEGYRGGGQDVADITAQLIPRLLEQGYQFVTVNQLWEQRIADHLPLTS